MRTETEGLARLVNERYISLTTFRRDGRAVPTPVWFAHDGDRLLVYTAATTGKVKRIRNNAEVTVAPCTARGAVTGPVLSATAVILPPAEGDRVQMLLNRKYGVIKRLYDLAMTAFRVVRRRKRVAPAYLAITLQ